MKIENLLLFATKPWARLSTLALTMVLFTGCAGLKEVQISSSPAMRNASIQVDVVGSTASNRGTVEGVPVSKYFQSGNAIRQGLQAKAMRFGSDQPPTQSITSDDPIWRGWISSKAVSIIVMADVPGVFDDLPGEADPRRKILPLSGKGAPKGIVHLEIYQGGLRVVTP